MVFESRQKNRQIWTQVAGFATGRKALILCRKTRGQIAGMATSRYIWQPWSQDPLHCAVALSLCFQRCQLLTVSQKRWVPKLHLSNEQHNKSGGI